MIMGRIGFPDMFPHPIHKQSASPGSVTGVRVDGNGICRIKDAYPDFEPELFRAKISPYISGAVSREAYG
jgi:hypothetical protein